MKTKYSVCTLTSKSMDVSRLCFAVRLCVVIEVCTTSVPGNNSSQCIERFRAYKCARRHLTVNDVYEAL